MTTFKGTSGNNDFTGGSGRDDFNLVQGGEDTASGAGGGDIFHMGGAFDAGDTLDGGAGSDSLFLNGDYSGGVTFTATTLVNVERILLADGFDYVLTTDDATVAAGEKMTVDASRLGAGHALTFDGRAETDGRFYLIGGAGDDVLKGGSAGDVYNLTHGGEDSVTGGSGNDVFSVGGALDAGDRIDGGFSFGNAHDVLRLNGDYSAGLTLGADTIQNIYTLQFDAGHSYKIVADNANFLSGPTVLIRADGLGAGNFLNFDGSASDADFHFVGGAGNDVLSGGTAADLFDLSHGGNDTAHGGDLADRFVLGATFNASDNIDGGAGNDRVDITGMDGVDNIAFTATTMTNVEDLVLGAGHFYTLASADATVANDATMLINGADLGAGDPLSFNGSAESNGHFILRGGAGNDILTGGAQSDTFNLTKGGADTANGGTGTDIFNMGGALTAADTIDGGGGADTLTLDGDYSAGLTLGAATITSVETLFFDGPGHSYRLTTNDAMVAAGTTLTVDGSAIDNIDALNFNGSAETDGHFAFTGGLGDDRFIGGTLSSTFNLTEGGNDTATGGAGNDTFTLGAKLNAADRIDGGDGNDSVIVSGNYSAGLTFTATTMVNVENLTLGGGNDYTFTTNEATIASGGSLTVNMVALGTGHTLTLDASAETDGAIVVTAGAAFTADDSFIVGTGQSALILNGDYSAGLVFEATTAQNLGDIELGGGHSYNITLNDATAAAGMAVDASALGAGDTLTVNGAAETNVTLNIFGGAGNDTITGGQAGDLINIGQGGNDTVHGGSGANEIDIGGALTAADSIDGGGNGGTYIAMAGNYTGANALVLGATTVTHVAQLQFGSGDSYDITTNDATVASGAELSVAADSLGVSDVLIFNGAAETDGTFSIVGGAGDDTLTGGNGADTFTGGAGEDTFKYTAAAQSTNTSYDHIADYAAGTDVFNFGGIVGGFDGTIGATVDAGANFNTDIGNAFSDSTLHGNHAWVVFANSGTLSGHSFLVVDTNNNAHYDGGADYVIDITGFTGTITAGDFI
ncbi:MAG TPA: calcium-binding protein [Rhizomicrobium sp.]|jgi:Ca2+-binding RTX toxin-like protein